MITWRADSPAAPPPMMQMSIVPSLTVPPSEEFGRLLSRVVCMKRARSSRPRMFVGVEAGGHRSGDRLRIPARMQTTILPILMQSGWTRAEQKLCLGTKRPEESLS